MRERVGARTTHYASASYAGLCSPRIVVSNRSGARPTLQSKGAGSEAPEPEDALPEVRREGGGRGETSRVKKTFL